MPRLDRSHEAGGVSFPSRPTDPKPYEGSPLPAVSHDLIAYLEAAFPDRLPPVGSAYVELERAWGRREVINHLKQVKEQLDNNVLIQQPKHAAAGNAAGPTAAPAR